MEEKWFSRQVIVKKNNEGVSNCAIEKKKTVLYEIKLNSEMTGKVIRCTENRSNGKVA